MFNFFSNNTPAIDATEVKKAIDERHDVIILDVRTSQEHKSGRIKGSINLSVELVPSNVEKAIAKKDAKIYVYCMSGGRSTQAVKAMQQLGYTNVFNMTSGVISWRAKGYPLV